MPTARQFRNDFTEVFLYLATNPDLGASIDWYAGHVPSSEHTLSLAGQLFGEVSDGPDMPANAWHCPEIPNGDFLVTEPGGDSHDFRIHLVSTGQLEGQRILKRREPGSRIYGGFATITRSGHLKLWRRFEREAGEPYVSSARILLEALRYLVSLEINTQSFQVNDIPYTYEGTRITFRHRCQICNAAADLTEHSDPPTFTPVPLCSNHITLPEPAPLVHEPDPELEALLAEEEAIERGAAENAQNLITLDPSRTAAPPRRRRSRRPEGVPVGVLLCQNGTGQVR